MSFTSDLREEFNKILSTYESGISKISNDAFSRVTSVTPKYSGTARGSWEMEKNGQTRIASLPHSKVKDFYSDPTKQEIKFKFGDTVNIYNNAGHIVLLENGLSPQSAPGNMVAATVIKIKNDLDRLG